jgi:hypothetical protein
LVLLLLLLLVVVVVVVVVAVSSSRHSEANNRSTGQEIPSFMEAKLSLSYSQHIPLGR